MAETFSTSPLKLLNGIQQNLTGSKISTSSTKFVFFEPIGTTRWPPGLWLAETFPMSLFIIMNGIQLNLTGRKILMSSTMLVYFGPIGKTRWPPCPVRSVNKGGTLYSGARYVALWAPCCFSVPFWIKHNFFYVFWNITCIPNSSCTSVFWWNLTGSKYSTSSSRFVFSVQSVNKGCTWYLVLFGWCESRMCPIAFGVKRSKHWSLNMVYGS